MPLYAKFMKEILLGKQKLRNDENIILDEKCNAIIQRKLPYKIINPSRFTIPCSICSLTIGHALYDLGSNINLMLLSMMRNLNCDEPKLTQMTLTLVDCSITYPYKSA